MSPTLSPEYRADIETKVDQLIEEASWSWYRMSVYFKRNGVLSSTHHDIRARSFLDAIWDYNQQDEHKRQPIIWP